MFKTLLRVDVKDFYVDNIYIVRTCRFSVRPIHLPTERRPRDTPRLQARTSLVGARPTVVEPLGPNRPEVGAAGGRR